MGCREQRNVNPITLTPFIDEDSPPSGPLDSSGPRSASLAEFCHDLHPDPNGANLTGFWDAGCLLSYAKSSLNTPKVSAIPP
jgi:hypothetical protein